MIIRDYNETSSKKKLVMITVYLVFSILLAGSAFIIWSITTGESFPLFTKSQQKVSTIVIDEEMAQKIADTAGPEKEFIAFHHQVLNDLTGWGAIDHPKWKDVHLEAENILDAMTNENMTDPILEKDFAHIKQLAEELTAEESKKKLKELHRLFHDLDVVMNGNEGSNNYFGVTKYGEAVTSQ
ncbi:hypothetical protein FZC66_10770 [Priestia megaterium]|nr:hypothetical protein FZC66_10770 [Priestia megaterium]